MRGRGYRVTERVAIVTDLQNALPWLQSNRTRCHVYRITERAVVVAE
jgi:hypothetical protein